MAGNQMIELTISLDEVTTARLREMAQRLYASPEDLAAKWITFVMAPRPLPLALREVEDNLRALDAIGQWGQGQPVVNTTNEEIDRILAEESVNPHDEEPEESGDTPDA